MTTSLRARLGIISLVFLGSVLPFQTFAAEPPACLLGVVTKTAGEVFESGTVSVTSGEWAYVLWVSAGATSVKNGIGAPVAQSGFVMAVPTTTTNYSYTFTGSGGEVTCSATLKVVDAPGVVQGPTTLKVSTVPLLSGGVASAGMSVPVSYLQITNTGTFATMLRGFHVEQTGNASTQAIVGLSTIDDKGGSVAVTGGAVGSTPFIDDTATARTEALFLPGQRRLFTIRAMMAPSVAMYRNTNVTLDVTGIETDAEVTGSFPIRGTTWLIQ